MLRKIKFSCSPQLSLLLPCHKLPGLTKMVIPPQFYLDKGEIAAVGGNDVNFSMAAAVVDLHNVPALSAQILCHQTLAPFAQQPGLCPAAHSFFRNVRR